jgi:hypothetical protein
MIVFIEAGKLISTRLRGQQAVATLGFIGRFADSYR